MTTRSERCPQCGSPKSSWLDGNCPTCLMRLGTLIHSSDQHDFGATRYLGDYEIHSEIARGGMGVVYRARQVSLNRMVAVKVLLGGQFANPTFIRRFRREAEAAASLNHPYIVSIYEVGEFAGQPYFSMELIEGRNLAELSRDNPLPVARAARLVSAIAEGVHFAHKHGLLHRDLKPSNVLVDELDTPHITDFGLAKRTEVDADLTLTGQILGSPNYMSPEQADPKRGPTTEASDVYSLGAILYHLLTGRPPFLAETLTRTLQLVSEGGPVAPRLLNPGISRDLETICLKCLETEPKQRYATAREVTQDLECVLKHEPISARPVGTIAKAIRWCRRKPALAAALAGVTVLLMLLAVGSPIALFRIQREHQASESARRREGVLRIRAQAAEREARQQLFTALIEQAAASVHSGEIGHRVKALDAIQRAAAISNSVALHSIALAALALPDLRLERELPTGTEFTLVLLDPAFESVALCRGTGPVEIRALSDWRLKATLPPSTNLPAYVAWWSADRQYLAVKRDRDPGGQLADLEVWEMSGPRRVLFLPGMSHNAASFHPTQHRLLVAQGDGGIGTWDLEQGRQITQFRLADEPVRLQYAPDGTRFAVAYESETNFLVAVYDAATGALQASHLFADPVLSFDWEPRGSWLAIASTGAAVYLMDPQNGEVRSLGNHKAQAVSATFSPDGRFLFSGGWEGELICWDMRTKTRSFNIGRQSWILQFRSDGQQCALINRASIQFYEFVRPKYRQFAEDLGPRLMHAAFSSDGRWLAASADQYLGVWDLKTDGPGALMNEVSEARPAFTPDGKYLWASGSGDTCTGWRVLPGKTGDLPPELRALSHTQPDGFASITVASNLVIVSGSKGSQIIDPEQPLARDDRWVRTPQGITGASTDGQWLGIYGSYTPSLYIYRLPGFERVAMLNSQDNIRDFVYSPLSAEVAVSSGGSVAFWSTRSWTQTRVISDFTAILFTPNSSAYWLTKDYRTAGLYDAQTLAPLLPLPTGTLPLALSSDGKLLAVSVENRHLQVWDLDEVRSQLGKLGLMTDIGSHATHISQH